MNVSVSMCVRLWFSSLVCLLMNTWVDSKIWRVVNGIGVNMGVQAAFYVFILFALYVYLMETLDYIRYFYLSLYKHIYIFFHISYTMFLWTCQNMSSKHKDVTLTSKAEFILVPREWQWPRLSQIPCFKMVVAWWILKSNRTKKLQIKSPFKLIRRNTM